MRIKWIVKFNLTGGPNNRNFSDPRSDFHLILLMVESYTVVILFIRPANLLIEREFGFSPFPWQTCIASGQPENKRPLIFAASVPVVFYPVPCFSRGGRWIVVLRDSVE